jgi:hypothetical protein
MRRKAIVLCSLLVFPAILAFVIFAMSTLPSALEEIVYRHDLQSPNNYTIYLQEHENGPYEPYLVLEADYDGGVLLLRYFLLDETMEYRNGSDNKPDTPGAGLSYYPDSDIDDYLCDTFLPSLAPDLQEQILETTISIADLVDLNRNSWKGEYWERKALSINRKVFLLSATELNIETNLNVPEGRFLRYFKNQKHWEAGITDEAKAKGLHQSYWLRSTYLWQDYMAWAISRIGINSWGMNPGYVYGGPAGGFYSLRPAFCLAPDTAITRAEVDGAERYVLAE